MRGHRIFSPFHRDAFCSRSSIKGIAEDKFGYRINSPVSQSLSFELKVFVFLSPAFRLLVAADFDGCGLERAPSHSSSLFFTEQSFRPPNTHPSHHLDSDWKFFSFSRLLLRLCFLLMLALQDEHAEGEELELAVFVAVAGPGGVVWNVDVGGGERYALEAW
ncbi:hypothetical protein GQ43DRAFT_139577 [Delitschia confertaspora ATCC 74209]|uniref:Uncharacterized protein n=1 Tax=Delitschia confertaspora ATCC 74209 TaxID=1513339 RepID=A0A9P4JIF2_9PLEO|nr:hypothetical protein GQ43DRAFT_139577 [Delitschia confertaspora ATCC 74209]